MAKKDLTKKEQVEIKNEIVDNLKEQIIYDVEKEIKNTIKNSCDSYKEDLKKEMLSLATDEVNNAVKREEKRFIRSKNMALLKKNILIIILLGIIGYFGYCLYDAKYFKFMQTDCAQNGSCENKENDKTNENTNNEEEVVKDAAWYLKTYSYLLNSSNLKLPTDNINAYYLYSGNHLLQDVKLSYLLNMAYANLNTENIKTNSSSVIVNSNDLKEAFLKTFEGIEYNPTNFSYGCLDFVYNEAKDRYTAENKKCESEVMEIIEIPENIYEEDGFLYIITHAVLYNNEEKSVYLFDNLYEPIIENIEKDQVSENTKKFNRYQYEYKIIDDNYYLEEISKLK